MVLKFLIVAAALLLVAEAACPGPNRGNGSTCKRNGQCSSGWCQNYYRTNCKKGSCNSKRNDGVIAYYSRKASCKSNIVRCGICGNKNRANSVKCSADSQCSSKFCKGKGVGTCSGVCTRKITTGYLCWKSAGSCITRGCKSNSAVCGVCGASNRANNSKCKKDSHCASGFCKGKNLASCGGRCKHKVNTGLNCWKNGAGNCITRGCKSNSAVCGKCGASNRANDSKCKKDSHCASGFCKGKNLASCGGRCKYKVNSGLGCWKNGAGNCIKRGCKANTAVCGKCGNTNLANGKTCEKDSNCASKFCKGGVLGQCKGQCKQKIANNYNCYKNGAGNCIDRGCSTGVGFCGKCGGTSVKRNEGAKCRANKNCKSGFCSGKTAACGGVCKTCPAECGEAGCHERKGELVCGDKNIGTWFSYLADDFSDTLGGLQGCFKPKVEYAECIAPVVLSAASCLKDATNCKLSLCPSGQNCQCFAFEKTFTKDTSHEFTNAQAKFNPDGAKVTIETSNEMSVAAIVTGGLQITPKPGLEVMVMQNAYEPLIQLASVIEIEAKYDYEFKPEKWTDRRIPLSKPKKVVTKVIMAGVIPVIVQVLVTPVAYVTIAAEFKAGAKITVNVDGNLKLKNPLSATLEFGMKKNSKVEFDLDGFTTSNFIADYNAVIEYKMKAAAEFNLDVKVGAEFTLMVEGVSATVFPSFEAKLFAKGKVYRSKKCSDCVTTKKRNCKAIVQVGVELGLSKPQALVSFSPAASLEQMAESSEPSDGCVELMEVADVACTALSADGGCGAMTTICKKSVAVLDIVTPSLKICVPDMDLFSVTFPSLKLPSSSWGHKEKMCFTSSKLSKGFLKGEITVSKNGVDFNYAS